MAEFSAEASSALALGHSAELSAAAAFTGEAASEVQALSVRSRRRTRLLVVAVLVASALASWLIAPRGQADAAACDELRVDVLALQRCVVSGGQAELDAGYVVRFDALSNSTVHWITGHRTSHGATFNALTNLQLGDRVVYRGAAFNIAEYQLVDRHAPAAVATWMSSGVPRLVLQTSASSPFVHVWRAELALPSPNPDTSAPDADSGAGGSTSIDAPRAAERVRRVATASVTAEGDTLVGPPSAAPTTSANSDVVTVAPGPATTSPAPASPTPAVNAPSSDALNTSAAAPLEPSVASADDRSARRSGVPYWRTWLR